MRATVLITVFFCLHLIAPGCSESGSSGEPGSAKNTGKDAAAQDSPDSKKALELFNSGREKLSARDYQGAIEDFDKALALYEQPDIYFNRADARSHKHDVDGAIEDYTKAIGMYEKAGRKHEASMAYNNRGAQRSEKKEYENAIEDYRKAIEMDPPGASSMFNWAAALAGLGKREEMLAKFREVIEIDARYRHAAGGMPEFKPYFEDEEFMKLLEGK